MEHAHFAASSHDHVLAAFLEPGALPDIAKRVNMSLASLATWAGRHADLLTNLHTLITTRCKLIAAHLELAALTALADVSSSSTATDDPRLRERALERQRKAANAILRHRTCLERTQRVKGASTGPNAHPNPSYAAAASAHAHALHASSIDALMPRASVPSSAHSPSQPKLSISQRLAARRLASLAAT